jgi:carotenoid cleavage dioxygenase-like enzyme
VAPTPENMSSKVVRWTFDTSKPGEKFEECDLGPGGDLPRVATKDAMTDYSVGYYERVDLENGPPLIAGPVGVGFNTLTRLEMKSGKHQSMHLDGRTTLQEPVHIPSKKPGHEGYLALVVDLHNENLSDVLILEAEHIGRGPIARIKLPLRLRTQVHGNWVAADSIE